MSMENMHVYYFSRDDSRLEIDFLTQHHGTITPVEVKAEENLRSKSLRTFVEAHNGTIEVDSELGIGTTFTMNFLIPTKL